jgi:hypothetical protein
MALLHEALTEASYEELVQAAAGKTKAEVQAHPRGSPRASLPRPARAHRAG